MHYLQGVVEVEEADFEANLEVGRVPVGAREAITEVQGVAKQEKERRKEILKSMDQIEDAETGDMVEGDVEEEAENTIRNHWQ